MVQIQYFPLAEAEKATGTVVAIDVLRAFTTAAFAFAQGVERILPVAEVTEALDLAEDLGGAEVMGEVKGFKPEGFTFSNSPGALRGLDLKGKVLVQRTSAGTQGLVRAVQAEALYAASFVVARATAQAVRRSRPNQVSFVITGVSEGRDGDEDLACAEYIAALVRGEAPDPEPFLARVATSTVGRDFASGSLGYLLKEDVQLCLQLDRFGFAMPVKRVGGRLEMVSEAQNSN
jgi:2-phosphosulfolactate phosphatase